MAQLLVDGSQSSVVGETFPSQLLAAAGPTPGATVDLSNATANAIFALLSVNTVSGFTSVSLAWQQSPDGTNWTNLVDPQTGLQLTQTITAAATQSLVPLRMQNPALTTTSANRYVRAQATLVGTNCQLYCAVIFTRRLDTGLAYTNGPPTI